MNKDERERTTERLRAIVATMPDKPGSYRFLDEAGTVIYVGKAKSLKRRVASYFHKEVDRYKTQVLVSKICDIAYTVVNSEEDALLLENSLIKKYRPKYNILLKDGKTYPSICVTKEPFPRIIKTRTINRKSGTYYGPYSHIGAMYAILALIKQLYKPRTCRLPLTEESIAAGRFKPCLEYHLHNCCAPCVGRQSRADYMQSIEQARELLKGNTRQLSREMRAAMMRAADELRFEDAAVLKRRCDALDSFCAKSEVVSHTIADVDAFAIINDERTAYVSHLHVHNGSVDRAGTYEIKKKLDESETEMLRLAVVDIRERTQSEAREIVVPFAVDLPIEGVRQTVPQQGDKRKLLDLALMNGRQYKFDRLKQSEKLNPEQRQTRLMKELQSALGMDKMPFHIECFDNSNISGSDAVSACVVFKALKASKNDYRKYTIRSVSGPDDYASMREVVLRRYGRMKDEGAPLPDLIITDGGRGQMEVVRRAVEDDLGLHIAIAGLAKDDRHRTNTLLFGSPPAVVGVKPDSELFRVLTQIQDEVHRFAITFHRDKRSRHALHSELDDIKGVGPKTKEALLKAFRSVRRIRESSVEALAAVVGQHKAAVVAAHFAANEAPSGEEKAGETAADEGGTADREE